MKIADNVIQLQLKQQQMSPSSSTNNNLLSTVKKAASVSNFVQEEPLNTIANDNRNDASDELIEQLKNRILLLSQELEYSKMSMNDEREKTETAREKYLQLLDESGKIRAELHDENCLRRELELELSGLLADRVQRLSERQIVEKLSRESQVEVLIKFFRK